MHANEKALYSSFISQKCCRYSVARILYNLNDVGVMLGALIVGVFKSLFPRHASIIHADKMIIESSMQYFASKSAHGLRALLTFLCFMAKSQFTGPLAGGGRCNFFLRRNSFSCSATFAFSCSATFAVSCSATFRAPSGGP